MQNRSACLTRNIPTAQRSIRFATARLSNSFPGKQLLWQKAAGAKVSEEATVENSDKNLKIYLESKIILHQSLKAVLNFYYVQVSYVICDIYLL